MKLTATTITDEQIVKLRDTSKRARRGESRSGLEVRNLCDMALSTTWPAAVVAEARARCAEILNARAEKKP